MNWKSILAGMLAAVLKEVPQCHVWTPLATQAATIAEDTREDGKPLAGPAKLALALDLLRQGAERINKAKPGAVDLAVLDADDQQISKGISAAVDATNAVYVGVQTMSSTAKPTVPAGRL